jgi:CRISPR system Cascade subunit CasC
MFIELHILQNFAPSNLNRDDTNSPKDCEFGGYRRARVSSQCLKRSIRRTFQSEELLPATNLASRTKRLLDALTDGLRAQGRAVDEARAVVQVALAGIKLGTKEDGKTQYLLFLGDAEIKGLVAVLDQHWDELAPLAVPTSEESAEPAKARSAKQVKKAGKDALPQAIGKTMEGVLKGGKAADLALFGRMLADLPDHNVDAACQVAHALSTNKVSMEFDFYTAVDDLKPDDTAGADMLGTVEFNSACFYRYANVDLGALLKNLDGDLELAQRTVEAFLHASILAVPTGKQNSMAAQNPPSLVMAVVRERGLWSLANAFVKPVAPNKDGDLVGRSVQALDSYWGKLTTMYGVGRLRGIWAASMEDVETTHLAKHLLPGVDQVIAQALAAAYPAAVAQ